MIASDRSNAILGNFRASPPGGLLICQPYHSSISLAYAATSFSAWSANALHCSVITLTLFSVYLSIWAA